MTKTKQTKAPRPTVVVNTYNEHGYTKWRAEAAFILEDGKVWYPPLRVDNLKWDRDLWHGTAYVMVVGQQGHGMDRDLDWDTAPENLIYRSALALRSPAGCAVDGYLEAQHINDCARMLSTLRRRMGEWADGHKGFAETVVAFATALDAEIALARPMDATFPHAWRYVGRQQVKGMVYLAASAIRDNEKDHLRLVG